MRGARSNHRKVDATGTERSSRSKSAATKKNQHVYGDPSNSVEEEVELTAERLGRAKPELNSAASYQPIFACVAKRMCVLGALNDDLAVAFNVAEDTIITWRKVHEDFFEACSEGEDLANRRVERSLHARACGYEYKVVKVMRHKGQPLRVTYLKHVPADVPAAIFWLVNRKPEEWGHPSKLKPKVEPETPNQRIWREAVKGAEGTMFRPQEPFKW
ncbi:MAG: hypothetical protein PSV22_05305 [Pseudolabrys sp.]|nr:hypothetical protein [Pseudolabrys sp.]